MPARWVQQPATRTVLSGSCRCGPQVWSPLLHGLLPALCEAPCCTPLCRRSGPLHTLLLGPPGLALHPSTCLPDPLTSAERAHNWVLCCLILPQ